MADKHKYKKYPFCPRQHLTKINKLSTHCTNLLSSTMYAISLSAYKHNHYINTLLKFPHIKHQTLEIKLYFSPKKKQQQQQKQCHNTHTHTHIYIYILITIIFEEFLVAIIGIETSDMSLVLPEKKKKKRVYTNTNIQ